MAANDIINRIDTTLQEWVMLQLSHQGLLIDASHNKAMLQPDKLALVSSLQRQELQEPANKHCRVDFSLSRPSIYLATLRLEEVTLVISHSQQYQQGPFLLLELLVTNKQVTESWQSACA